jgi:hypothetical protein
MTSRHFSIRDMKIGVTTRTAAITMASQGRKAQIVEL